MIARFDVVRHLVAKRVEDEVRDQHADLIASGARGRRLAIDEASFRRNEADRPAKSLVGQHVGVQGAI